MRRLPELLISAIRAARACFSPDTVISLSGTAFGHAGIIVDYTRPTRQHRDPVRLTMEIASK
jgi:1-aminocyclopropane-1-carboxylate deaminase/D-cysteine desulfhydrase-like pyridoxal-dependent ACC family enzyme